MPTYTLSEWPLLYDSSDMSSPQWNQIAIDINEKYNDVTGFVILCGTDTMSYAASALSFMLKNTDKPVVFTGSSIPFGEVHSDARRNLIVSIAIAAFVDIPEVMIFFNEALMRGNRTRKKVTYKDVCSLTCMLIIRTDYICRIPGEWTRFTVLNSHVLRF